MSPMETRLLKFILAREAVRVRREERGDPPPWTSDPILSSYRFTNVHREDDKVTRWIAEHVRAPYARHPQLWFMLCIARLVNLPSALQELIGTRHAFGLEKSWQPNAFATVLEARQRREVAMVGGAYMITTQGVELSKPRYLAQVPLQGLWARWQGAKASFAQRLSGTLAEAHTALMETHGWGPFLAAQVVADLKHTRYLAQAPDWWNWAALGPGSVRGLLRVQGIALGSKAKRGKNGQMPGYQPSPATAARNIVLLTDLRAKLAPGLKAARLKLCLQDFQNCLCEFDKYERARKGEGRPKQSFNPLKEAPK